MLAAVEWPLKQLFDFFRIALAHQLGGGQAAGRENSEDVVVELYQIITYFLDGWHRLRGIGILGMAEYTFGEGDAFDANIPNLAVPGDGVAVNISTAIYMTGRQEALDFGVFSVFHVAQLGEKAQ